jgi:molybdopterin-containing oxidoreductase family membrane subunit
MASELDSVGAGNVGAAGVRRLFMVGGGEARHQALGKRFLQVLAVLSALGLAAGAVAWKEGHHALGTTAEMPWGLLIATYVFFVVSSTGLCLVSSLGHVFGMKLFEPLAKRAIVLALVTLLVGFAVMSAELEHPVLLLAMVILSPNPFSPIWWMGTLYGLYMIFIAVELFFLLRDDHRHARTAGILGIIAAVTAHSNLGAVFGLSHARPYWYGPFLPIYFIASALLCGAALLILVVYLEDWFTNDRKLRAANEPLIAGLGKLLTLFLFVVLFFTAWKIIAGVAGEHHHKFEVTMAMLSGPLFFSFWFFETFLAFVVPLTILLGAKRRQPGWIAMAAALPMLAVFVMRYNFVVAGQMFSLKPVVGLRDEVIRYGPPFKGSAAGFLPYTPSLIEVAIVVGAIAAAILLFVVGTRMLKLRQEEA